MPRLLLSGVFVCLLLAPREACPEPRRGAGAQDCNLQSAALAAARGDFRQSVDLATQVLACPGIDDVMRSQAHFLRARSLMRLSKNAEAREAVREAIRFAPARKDPSYTASIYHELGWILFELEGAASARTEWLTAMDLVTRANDKRGMHRMRLALLMAMEPGPERQTVTEEGLAAARAEGDATHEAGYLQRLGEQYMFDGRYIDAIVALRAAATAFEQQGRTPDLMRARQQLSRLYRRHGRLDLAQQLMADTARLVEASKMPGAAALVLNLRAISESAKGNTAKAVEYQRQAVALATRTDARRSAGLLNLELAWMHIHAGQPQDAVAIIEQITTNGDPFIARIAWDPLSVAYLALGRYQDALHAADRAIAGTLEPSGTPPMLGTRARARRALGQREEALADVRDALLRIERTRATLIPTDSMKQGYAEFTQDLFDLAITLHAELGHATEALSIAEQARSRAFLDLLASRRDQEALDALDAVDAADAARHAAASTIGGIPSVAHAEPLTASGYAALAARLRSTVLVYWVGAEHARVWLVPPSGATIMKTIPATRAGLRRLVAGTLPGAGAGMRSGEPQSPPLPTAVLDVATRRANWRTLHQLLIEPVSAALPRDAGARLTIVPHGPLAQLSFAALRAANDQYLLERYAVHYLPAAAAGAPPAGDISVSSALIIGAPDRFPAVAGLHLSPLPGARAEARAVARHYRAGTAETMLGAGAGERAFRDRLEQAGFLHFATHAVTPPEAPLEAFLALRPGSGASDDDGRLTLAEIYQLRVPARLVVLSACRSASGEDATDGVAGFARAFLSAGARTVVGGLWEIPDLTSATLMKDFYAHLDQGHASALRRAQLTLIAALRARQITIGSGDRKAVVPEDPALWAGFIVLGEP